ncbi:MAG: transposase, partial [Planctomycetaceae bacterium]
VTRAGGRTAGRGAGHGGLTAPGGGWPGVPGHMPLDGAYLKEDFQWFWEYRSPTVAMRFLDEWCGKVMRSRLEPMKWDRSSKESHFRSF